MAESSPCHLPRSAPRIPFYGPLNSETRVKFNRLRRGGKIAEFQTDPRPGNWDTASVGL